MPSRKLTIGIPSLSRSRLAAYSSACALLKRRCVRPASGTRIWAIDTSRTFDVRRRPGVGLVLRARGMRLSFLDGSLSFLSQPANKGPQLLTGLAEGLQPLGIARSVHPTEIDQIDVGTEVHRRDRHALDDA